MALPSASGGQPSMLDSAALESSFFDFLPSVAGLDWELDHRGGGAEPLEPWAKDLLAPLPASGTSSSSMGGMLDLILDENLDEGNDAEEEEGPGRKEGRGQELAVQPTRCAAKEKNRVAQKLFRVRSKQRQKETEERVQALETRLKKLELEKTAAEARTLILEQIVRLNVPNAMRHSLSVKAELQTVKLFQPRSGWSRPQLTRTVHLAIGPPNQLELVLSPEAAKELTWAKFSSLWKVFVNKLAGCLNALALGETAEEADRDIQELVAEATGMMAFLALHNPRIMQTLQSVKIGGDSVETHGPEEATMWERLWEVLQLSDTQKTNLLAARRRYLQELAVVMSIRLKVYDSLDLQLQTLRITDRSPVQANALLSGISDQLMRHVDETHACICTFMEYAWKRVLTPDQAAKFIVTAYPWGPDMMTCVHTLAAEAGEPPAPPLMQAPPATHVLTAIAPGAAYMHATVGTMIPSGIC